MSSPYTIPDVIGRVAMTLHADVRLVTPKPKTDRNGNAFQPKAYHVIVVNGTDLAKVFTNPPVKGRNFTTHGIALEPLSGTSNSLDDLRTLWTAQSTIMTALMDCPEFWQGPAEVTTPPAMTGTVIMPGVNPAPNPVRTVVDLPGTVDPAVHPILPHSSGAGYYRVLPGGTTAEYVAETDPEFDPALKP